MGKRQRWRNNTRIVIAMMKPNTAIGKVISSKVCNRSSDEVSNTWSEPKATQNQLVQSEKIALLSELTAGIAHEI